MNIVGLTNPREGALWEWVAADRNGNRRTYQTHTPDVSESTVLAHLKRHYPHCEIVRIERIASGRLKPPTEKPMEARIYESGAKEKFINDFAALSPNEQAAKLSEVSRLPPVIMQNGDTMPDPLKVAVITTVQVLEQRREQQPPPRASILHEFKPIRQRFIPIR